MELDGYKVTGTSPPYLMYTEAAKFLRIAPRTLSRLVRYGRVPCIGRGRLRRFRREDLLRLSYLPTRTELEAASRPHAS